MWSDQRSCSEHIKYFPIQSRLSTSYVRIADIIKISIIARYFDVYSSQVCITLSKSKFDKWRICYRHFHKIEVEKSEYAIYKPRFSRFRWVIFNWFLWKIPFWPCTLCLECWGTSSTYANDMISIESCKQYPALQNKKYTFLN